MKIAKRSIVLLTIITMAACSQSEQSGQQDELIKTVNVETRTIEPEPFERYLRLIGTVEAGNDIRISAEVAGRVVKYFVEKGDEVDKNEPIAQIDDSQLKREKERLEAVTAQAKENYERLKRLYEEEGVGSEIEYLNAKYNYRQNKAALESVKVSLEKTTVKAPFDGTVEDKLIEEGEMVSPGTVMVRLIGLDDLKISAGVPARFSDVVNRGDSSQVWFEYASSDTLTLPITFVGQSIDPQARTFEAEILLPSNSPNYKMDMVANVKIKTLTEENVIVVGEDKIYQKEDEYVVYVVSENSEGNTIANERPVILGANYENRVVIKQGLRPGDRLITVGSSFVQDNMRIHIVDNREDEFAQRRGER